MSSREQHILYTHLHKKLMYGHTHTPLVSLVQSPLQKPLSHRNQESKKRHQSCLYNETERAVPCCITDCTQESIPPFSGEQRKKKRERRKSPPPEQCSTTTAEHTQKERAKMRESMRQQKGCLFQVSLVYQQKVVLK